MVTVAVCIRWAAQHLRDRASSSVRRGLVTTWLSPIIGAPVRTVGTISAVYWASRGRWSFWTAERLRAQLGEDALDLARQMHELSESVDTWLHRQRAGARANLSGLSHPLPEELVAVQLRVAWQTVRGVPGEWRRQHALARDHLRSIERVGDDAEAWLGR